VPHMLLFCSLSMVGEPCIEQYEERRKLHLFVSVFSGDKYSIWRIVANYCSLKLFVVFCLVFCLMATNV